MKRKREARGGWGGGGFQAEHLGIRPDTSSLSNLLVIVIKRDCVYSLFRTINSWRFLKRRIPSMFFSLLRSRETKQICSRRKFKDLYFHVDYCLLFHRHSHWAIFSGGTIFLLLQFLPVQLATVRSNVSAGNCCRNLCRHFRCKLQGRIQTSLMLLHLREQGTCNRELDFFSRKQLLLQV